MNKVRCAVVLSQMRGSYEETMKRLEKSKATTDAQKSDLRAAYTERLAAIDFAILLLEQA